MVQGSLHCLEFLQAFFNQPRGEVELILDGQRIPRELHALNVGFVASYLNVYEDLTLRENLAFLMRARSMNKLTEHMESTVEEVGMSGWIDAQVGTYSTGMQQRARFAAALLHRPRVLLLDEPMTGLDAKGRAAFEKAISRAQEAGHQVAIVSNSEDEICLTSRALCVEDCAPRSAAPVQPSRK